MVIRRIADAAKTEHDIATRQRAAKGVGQALPVIAQIHRPIQMHAACSEDFQQAREMAIRALAMCDFVADDDGANRLPVAICILHKKPLEYLNGQTVDYPTFPQAEHCSAPSSKVT